MVKKVFVRGEVISSLDLIDIECFTLKSKKGNILVISDNLLPLKRDKIWITGVVKRIINTRNETFWLLLKKRKS